MEQTVKHSGQVFTPQYLVDLILDEAGYKGPDILRKHCIDNSCGDGAFLCTVIQRYIDEYIAFHGSLTGVEQELHEYVHGIEIDSKAYLCCLDNLNRIAAKHSLNEVVFDIMNEDALTVTKYNERMDFVVGNPPYVRVHNLDNSYSAVKSFSFASSGMTDLYIVFFEIGLRMLHPGGTMSYITPSSWLNSLAGSNLRKHILRHKCLRSLIDLGHYQAFDATTYTLISTIVKGTAFDTVSYYIFNPDNYGKLKIDDLTPAEMSIGQYFYISDKQTLSTLREIRYDLVPRYTTVKNGFATLADNVFIGDVLPFDDFVIPVIKASTGKWRQAFYPYDTKGTPISKDKLFANKEVETYLMAHRGELVKRDSETSNPGWFYYGRTQALKDVSRDKLAINAIVKDVESIKLNFVPEGSGVYSGLYVLTAVKKDLIEKIIKNEQFIHYIASLKKYKSGGYYTFNSKDLEMYLNYQIYRIYKQNKHSILYEDTTKREKGTRQEQDLFGGSLGII